MGTFLFSENVLFTLASGLAFLAFFFLGWAIAPNPKTAALRNRLGIDRDQVKPRKQVLLRVFHRLYRLITPLFYTAQMPSWIRKWKERRVPVIAKRLRQAGLDDEIGGEDFVSFQIASAVVFPLFCLYLSGIFQFQVPSLFWVVSFPLGALLPDLWLKEKISVRKRDILRSMPFVMDLLTLSVEAGLDFVAAIRRMGRFDQGNALIQELNAMAREVRLGKARSDALRSMADRLDIDQIGSFVSLLIQADQLGASIGTVLRAQSEQIRSKRFQDAETAGARASQLVLFPLILFIFPAILIIVLGPSAINILQRGLF